MWFVEDKRKCISDFLFFLLEFLLCYKKLDHGGDTVDMPLSKILFKNPQPIKEYFYKKNQSHVYFRFFNILSKVVQNMYLEFHTIFCFLRFLTLILLFFLFFYVLIHRLLFALCLLLLFFPSYVFCICPFVLLLGLTSYTTSFISPTTTA